MLWALDPKLSMLPINRADDLSLTHNNSNKNTESPKWICMSEFTRCHAPGRACCPAKNSTCWSCGRIGHWDIRCQSTSSRQKGPNKKPPRCGPKGGKQKQTHSVDVGNDYDLQCHEVCVTTIDVHLHHSASLGWEPEDDHARPSEMSPWVAQNAHPATIVPPISMLSPAPSDPEHINITAINIDALTDAWATVTMPPEIGPNQFGSLRCKVDTGASGNVMPLCIFAKLFPRCITRDGKPTRVHPCDARLTA